MITEFEIKTPDNSLLLVPTEDGGAFMALSETKPLILDGDLLNSLAEYIDSTGVSKTEKLAVLKTFLKSKTANYFNIDGRFYFIEESRKSRKGDQYLVNVNDELKIGVATGSELEPVKVVQESKVLTCSTGKAVQIGENRKPVLGDYIRQEDKAIKVIKEIYPKQEIYALETDGVASLQRIRNLKQACSAVVYGDPEGGKGPRQIALEALHKDEEIINDNNDEIREAVAVIDL